MTPLVAAQLIRSYRSWNDTWIPVIPTYAEVIGVADLRAAADTDRLMAASARETSVMLPFVTPSEGVML